MNLELLKGDIPEVLLPKVSSIKDQLNRRIKRLKKSLEKAVDAAEEIIIEDEIKKCSSLLTELDKFQIEFQDNDLSLVHTHAALELEYFKAKSRIEEKMSNHQLLSTEEVSSYNNTLHKFNLFINVLETL